MGYKYFSVYSITVLFLKNKTFTILYTNIFFSYKFVCRIFLLFFSHVYLIIFGEFSGFLGMIQNLKNLLFLAFTLKLCL